jgi:excisionase family DNA binding protein
MEQAMGRQRNFGKHRHRGKPREAARPTGSEDKGPWTHVKPDKGKIYTPEEIERFKKERGWKYLGHHFPEKLTYTVREACFVTGLSKSTIYNLFRKGALRKRRLAGRTLIKYADLLALIDGGYNG